MSKMSSAAFVKMPRSQSPKPKLEVIALASAEVRSSILYATILIILVFLPLIALSGVEGRLFTPIAVATMISMAASFVVSLTVIPVLSSYLLNPKPGKGHDDGFFVRILKKVFSGTLLRFSLAQPLLLLALTIGLIVFSGITFTKMGGNFLPAFREPTAVIATTMAPGTSLKTTRDVSRTAQDLLLKIEGRQNGRLSCRTGGTGRSCRACFHRGIRNRVSMNMVRRTAMKSWRKCAIPCAPFPELSAPSARRSPTVSATCSAEFRPRSRSKFTDRTWMNCAPSAVEIVDIARDIPGMEEARTEQQGSVPQLRIEIDRDRAAAYGVTPGELNEELADLIGGGYVAEIYENQRVYDLVVRLPTEWREDPEKLRNLYIDTHDGGRIPLKYVAEIRQANGPNTILRENTQRRFVVSINPTTPDLNAVVEQLQTKVAEQIELPEGYTISFEGEYQAQQEARRTIIIMSTVILLVIAFLLYSFFKSFSFVMLVLTNIPISLIGGILLTRFTLDNVSIATLVGFIAISGIAARNSIMMISHYLHLMAHEGEEFTLKMVIRGTEERLVPVLMTAISAGVALIPLVLAADEPGKEILNPVAIVIVGGLISATLLGLAVTPAIFYQFCRKSAQRSLDRGASAAA